MHLTRVENSNTKRVSLFWHTRYKYNSQVSALLVEAQHHLIRQTTADVLYLPFNSAHVCDLEVVSGSTCSTPSDFCWRLKSNVCECIYCSTISVYLVLHFPVIRFQRTQSIQGSGRVGSSFLKCIHFLPRDARSAKAVLQS